MVENVNVYVSGIFFNAPGRNDNRFGYAGVAISCPVYENFMNMNSEEPLLELENVETHMITPARAKLWSVIRGMEAILERFNRYGATRGMKYTLISDDLNAVKNILERGPSYVKKYGSNIENWRNSRNGPVLDADLIQKGMELYKGCRYRVENYDLQEFELTYRPMNLDDFGPGLAHALAEQAANVEKRRAQGLDDYPESEDEYFFIDGATIGKPHWGNVYFKA